MQHSSRAFALTILGIALIGFTLIASMQRDVFWITDGGNKFIQVQQQMRTPGEDSIEYPGRGIDPGLRFFPSGGHHFVRIGTEYFSFYPSLFPKASVPTFRLFGTFGLYLLPFAAFLGTLVLGAALVQVCGDSISKATFAWFLAATSPLLFYGVTFWEHSLAYMFATGGLLAVLHAARVSDLRWAVLAGVAVGFSTAFREEGYVLLAAMVFAHLVVIRKKGHLAALVGGWVFSLAPIWISQWTLHGGPLGLHSRIYADMAGFSDTPGLLSRIYRELIDSWFFLLQGHEEPEVALFLGLPALMLVVVGWGQKIVKPFVVVALLGLTQIAALIGTYLLVSAPDPLLNTLSSQSLLIHMPVLVLPAYSLRWLVCNPRKSVRFLAVTCLCYIFGVIIALNRMDVGVIWGPRHFLAIASPLAILTVISVRNLYLSAADRRIARFVAISTVVLVMCGVVIQTWGLGLLGSKKSATAELRDILADNPSDVVISTVFWLPEEMASLYFERRFFSVADDQELGDLLRLLRMSGTQSVGIVLPPTPACLSPAGRDWLNHRARSVLRFRPEGLSLMDVDVLDLSLHLENQS